MRQLLACCFSLMLLALPARALELAAGSGEAAISRASTAAVVMFRRMGTWLM